MISGQGVKVYNGEFYLNCIKVPLVFKYYASKGFNLELSPQLSFLNSAELKAFGGNKTVDVSNRINNDDFSIVFGGCYDVDKNFLIDLRYNLSLSQVQYYLTANETPSKNSVFQFSLGYKFKYSFLFGITPAVLREELSYGKDKIIKMINEELRRDVITAVVLR